MVILKAIKFYKKPLMAIKISIAFFFKQAGKHKINAIFLINHQLTALKLT